MRNTMKNNRLLAALTALLMLLAASVQAALPGMTSVDDDIPSAADAIQVNALALPEEQAILVSFSLYPHVYLYRHKLAFRLLDTHGNLLNDFADYQPPAGKPKVDEIFGDVEVYYDFVEMQLPLASVPLVDAILEVKSQGCLEDVLCYPPRTSKLPISFLGEASTADAGNAAAAQPSAPVTSNGFVDTLSSQDANAFSNWMGQHGLGMIVLLFFAGGLLLAFTPCVFPMIPILSGIIAGAGTPSAKKGFSLSFAYVLGVAVPYTVAGMLVASFGAGLNLQVLLQHPAAIITSAVVFVLLSLAMFGLYEMQLPEFLRSRLHHLGDKQQGGSLTGAAIMGAISGLVVSPCVTPILAGSLIYVAGTGDLLTGALSLFFLAFGMGVPLIIMGTGGGHLLPRAGGWMEEIKRFFGITMLGIAIWLLDRIIADTLAMGLMGFLLAGYGVYLGAFEQVAEGASRLKRTIALMLALYGMLLVVGAAGGGSDPLQPLQRQANASATVSAPQARDTGAWRKLVGSAALQQAMAEAQAAGKPMLVDFYADWCVACKVLEEETLNQPEVLAALGSHVLIKADITEINDDSQRIMEQYQILGLPALVFFDANGNEIPGKRILGEMGPDKFLAHLATF